MRLDRAKLCAIIVKKDLTSIELSKKAGISAQTMLHKKRAKLS